MTVARRRLRFAFWSFILFMSALTVLFAWLGVWQMERLAATGENRTAEEALAIGLVDQVVPAAELSERAFERARFLGGLSSPAHAAIKRRSRAAALARFDQARDHDPFLDFWFSEDARFRIRDMVARLSSRA